MAGLRRGQNKKYGQKAGNAGLSNKQPGKSRARNQALAPVLQQY